MLIFGVILLCTAFILFALLPMWEEVNLPIAIGFILIFFISGSALTVIDVSSPKKMVEVVFTVPGIMVNDFVQNIQVDDEVYYNIKKVIYKPVGMFRVHSETKYLFIGKAE